MSVRMLEEETDPSARMRAGSDVSALSQASAGALPARPKLVLTNRELNIVREVAGGLSNKQIARRLGISEKTVRNHLTRAFDKLHVTNRTEAVMRALRLGLYVL